VDLVAQNNLSQSLNGSEWPVIRQLGLPVNVNLMTSNGQLNDNVLYIHYFGWQARSRFGGIVRDGDDLLKRIADTKCAQ
jgi:hypothetical protein